MPELPFAVVLRSDVKFHCCARSPTRAGNQARYTRPLDRSGTRPYLQSVQKEAAAKTPAPPKEPAITFNSVHVDGPYIAMTFDDGPSAALTPKLLDLLAAHHIKATFFVISKTSRNIRRSSREPPEGHEIASHSWSHPNLAKMSQEGVRSQLQRTDDAIKSATGKVPRCCGHRMDQLPNAKNDGSTTNSDTTSFFGTLIRSTGNDPARR